MATVTGRLLDFGLTDMDAFNPRILFYPSGPAVSVGRLLATKPVIAYPDAVGDFSVALATTDTTTPETWYTIRIEWFDTTVAGDGYVGADFPEWKLYVPAAGGDISDLIEVPANPGMFWIGPTPPPVPSRYVGWIDNVNIKYYEWS